MGKIFVWIMCTLLLALTVQAVTTVTLVDTNGNKIAQGLVYMQQGEKTTEYILDKEIPIILDENIDEEITLFIKEENKEAFSYNAIIDKGIAPNKIILHPVALISGIVTDTKDNLIKGAQITAQCTTTTKQTLSDATGYYRLYIPTESCTITAYAHEKGATTTVSLQKGEAKMQDILLEQEAKKSSNLWNYFIILLIVIVILILLFWQKPKKKKKGTVTKKHKHEFVAERVKDTLKEKERLIVDELLLNKGKLTMAQIRHQTQLPRTSLTRTIQGLEQRSILIKKKEHGKIYIELIKV